MIDITEIEELDLEDYSFPSLLSRYRKNFVSFWTLFSDSPFGLIGVYLVIFFVLIAVLAPQLALYDPNKSMTGEKFEGVSFEHPLGTDRTGRDIFSQMVWGTQISLIIGMAAAFISVVVGTTFGLLAGFYGGWIDALLMRITDFFVQIPQLPLMMVVMLIFGGGLGNMITVIGLLGWTRIARVVRAETLSLKERQYIEATRSIGASNWHIIFFHILPNVLPLITSNAIINVVDSIIAEAGLSFLGFGAAGTWTWGKVLHEASRENAILTQAWYHFIPPGLCIMLLALGFALISFSLNEVVNPRLREK